MRADGGGTDDSVGIIIVLVVEGSGVSGIGLSKYDRGGGDSQ